ncbi:hypothetical protein AMES_3738 [Amycolatopsis mediterranei S699]|uniref:Uncharacterized protein n=2 Tax=Amycolatopsis mediterranei TaxID=33910 RepID=A0A0H3D5K1_AMYMU|nr:DUF5947 family protein [Amycolatopsis mediterranei]ADJ45562.1 conserved hypothetical protein [Amycolatopsis mediterranei U32]AEK42338.1 hypothetical protein RAM_19260 [Amycolatopsis mediterranei S699]AFO77274.1 hypothetical protein AMES_3738 [Amycolatopsis mediterranei S699]AGT84402.1 hypothetical protein B737_3738 [Amycolatopsis mediterranei RB]KDO05820.1 hypothetical protein DV26_36270 [Amycolatopsis mediterranei]
MSVGTGATHPAFARDRRSARPERCELCGTPVAARHGHVVDTGRRGLLCACRACFLLFTRCPAGEVRYRAVPERYLWDPRRPIAGLDWHGLGIPARFAFFIPCGTRVTAFQPGPAGVAETALPPGLWTQLAAEHPLLATAEPDVEAIVVRGGERGTDCFLVPVDVGYRLAGAVRRYWTGGDGGPELHERVGELFAEIGQRARPLR